MQKLMESRQIQRVWCAIGLVVSLAGCNSPHEDTMGWAGSAGWGASGFGGTGGVGGIGGAAGSAAVGGEAGTAGVGGEAGAAGLGGTGATAGTSGIGGAGGSTPFPPEPPPEAIVVDPFPQPPGDPAKGYDYIINGEYQRLGPDLFAFKASQPLLAPGDALPGRRGDNVGLSYMFNAATADDGARVAAVNCLSCHATHIRGELIVGLGRPNRMVRMADVNVLGIAFINPLALNQSIGTLTRLLGGVALGVMDVFPYLASHRDPETLVWSETEQHFNPDAGVQGWVDIAPWWRTKKKNGLYSNGSGRGVQGHHMAFMSIFSVKDTTEAAEIERNFNDVAAYLRSIEPPPFPGPINQELAQAGEAVFVNACASCHGTYGENETYPNVIIPYQDVGTDPSLATGHWMKPGAEWYSQSWYAREGKSWVENVEGYYAPPLDGIWATAPFFHNGSVPTLDGVIDPSKRPAVWTSNMSEDDFDLERVGWMDKPFDGELTLDGRNGTFDTSVIGNSNAGHTYGADLTTDEQRAVFEYLKTL